MSLSLYPSIVQPLASPSTATGVPDPTGQRCPPQPGPHQHRHTREGQRAAGKPRAPILWPGKKPREQPAMPCQLPARCLALPAVRRLVKNHHKPQILMHHCWQWQILSVAIIPGVVPFPRWPQPWCPAVSGWRGSSIPAPCWEQPGCTSFHLIAQSRIHLGNSLLLSLHCAGDLRHLQLIPFGSRKKKTKTLRQLFSSSSSLLYC